MLVDWVAETHWHNDDRRVSTTLNRPNFPNLVWGEMASASHLGGDEMSDLHMKSVHTVSKRFESKESWQGSDVKKVLLTLFTAIVLGYCSQHLRLNQILSRRQLQQTSNASLKWRIWNFLGRIRANTIRF